MSDGWHIATIQPGRGEAVCEQMDRDGFEHWRPMHECWRRKRGARTRERISKPCLPAYLFIALTPRIWAARRVSGVTGLIMCGSEPAVVPDAALDPMREMIGSHGADEAAEVCRLAIGTLLEILEGPLAGLTGQLAATDGRTTVEIASNKWPGKVTAHIADVRVLG